MDNKIRVFYDEKGNPDAVQIDYKEYQQLIHAAKENAEQKAAIKKACDLLHMFA
jgi:hypothetical protein